MILNIVGGFLRALDKTYAYVIRHDMVKVMSGKDLLHANLRVCDQSFAYQYDHIQLITYSLGVCD